MENPSFYAIIPAFVRYAPIKANAKLLYWEITALSNKTGVCYATNNYFAQLYWVTEKQIKIWIHELIKYEFLESEIDKKGGNKRKIYISQKVPTSAPKSYEVGTKKLLASNQKVTSYNRMNIKYNNKFIIIDENKKNNDFWNIDLFNQNRKTDTDIYIIPKENEFIESVEELRMFLNVGKLQETFFYKIGDLDSFERLTTDFFYYMEDKWKKIPKKTAEWRFISFLKPKWETEKDREDLKRAYLNKLKKSNINTNTINEAHQQEEEIQKTKENIIKIEWKLSEEQKRHYRQLAEKQVLEYTKWIKWNDKIYGLMVQNKYNKIILDIKDK